MLYRILRDKKAEIERCKKMTPLSRLKQEVAALGPKKDIFLPALKKRRPLAVIAEIKRRSPSKGLLCKRFDPVRIAREYQKAGASALSVLTDTKYFGGSERILRQVRKATKLPILRKDFVLDEYQIFEARRMGADAVLLIARILSAAKLKYFRDVAASLGLGVLLEVHDEADLRKCSKVGPCGIGINNRDLGSFRVSLDVTRRLAPKAPKGRFLVSESGISTVEDIAFLKKCGVRAVLVGETLMRDPSPARALKRLLGN
jgi:indole-3-glycerol phosphate synthase